MLDIARQPLEARLVLDISAGEVHGLVGVKNLPKVSACNYVNGGENQSDFQLRRN